jgi:4a-hydroxytetrahydrobiopterin dehydratase
MIDRLIVKSAFGRRAGTATIFLGKHMQRAQMDSQYLQWKRKGVYMTSLASQTCKPCEEGAQALHGEELKTLHRRLGNSWMMIDEHHLEKVYPFKDFREALDFVNRVGELAEKANHHPDLHLSYGKVKMEIWSHKAGGLTENDFILAAQADQKVSQ